MQLRGAGAWLRGARQPWPALARHGPAVVRPALQQGDAAAGMHWAAGSREERGLWPLQGWKAPFWAVSASPRWKAPPESVLQVSSLCLFWKTAFFHVREIQTGSKKNQNFFVCHSCTKAYRHGPLWCSGTACKSQRMAFEETKSCFVPGPRRFPIQQVLSLLYFGSFFPFFFFFSSDWSLCLSEVIPGSSSRCCQHRLAEV